MAAQVMERMKVAIMVTMMGMPASRKSSDDGITSGFLGLQE